MKLDQIFGLATETLWGLACMANDVDAVEEIFRLKGRNYQQPLTLFVDEVSKAQKIQQIPQALLPWLKHHWPGPLTLVSKALTKDFTHCHPLTDAVGIRIPAHPEALRVLHNTPCPLAVTSFNRSGQPPVESKTELLKLFPGKITQAVGEIPHQSRPSCVLSLQDHVLKVLRGTPEQARALQENLPLPYQIIEKEVR